MAHEPDTATVVAVRAGDPAAADRLVAQCLPLVYTIVGRALEGHADVDDVVQDVLLRMLSNVGELRDPRAFRPWLLSITVRHVRERLRARRGAPEALLPEDVRDPGADFTDLSITRLELCGQRRETAEATRWLDEDDRVLLALWWLEAAGELTRDEIVAALGVTRQHAVIRIQRMKGQLETARVVARAVSATPACPDLHPFIAQWDGQPGPRWRRRIARHTRECRDCGSAWAGLVPTERLLAARALVPAPLGLAGRVGQRTGPPPAAARTGDGRMYLVAKVGSTLSRKLLAAALSTTTAAAAGAAVLVAYQRPEPPATALIFAPAPSPSGPSAGRTVGSPRTLSTSATPAGPRLFSARVSTKKGVSVWKFTGVTAALADVHAVWYYNGTPTGGDVPVPPGVEFVPMFRSEAQVSDATLAQVRRAGNQVLGFDEPDRPGQGDISVADALAVWPRLAATGLRLGSPAVADGADTPGGWLDRFMTGAQQLGLRVDFITLHWYGDDVGDAGVNQFLGYVDAVHRRYGKPVWVTEYGLATSSGAHRDPTPAQVGAFIKASIAGLEGRPYVERYAWFALPAVGETAAYGLYAAGGSPTAAGRAYRAAG